MESGGAYEYDGSSPSNPVGLGVTLSGGKVQ